jgi:DNA-binding NarL/FixJ family response regulator
MELGVDGYILKDADPKILLDAIRSVLKGESYIQPNMTKEMFNEISKVSSPRTQEKDLGNKLTLREIDVIKLIADGLLNKEIAKKLFISEKTVKNHVSNILRKLDVADRTGAAIYAYKHNIVE